MTSCVSTLNGINAHRGVISSVPPSDVSVNETLGGSWVGFGRIRTPATLAAAAILPKTFLD